MSRKPILSGFKGCPAPWGAICQPGKQAGVRRTNSAAIHHNQTSYWSATTMKWITRERVKVDRVACPWLISRFVDENPEFLFAPGDQVMAEAERLGAIPYDVSGVELGHDGPRCSFDAFLKTYNLEGKDEALDRLAL